MKYLSLFFSLLGTAILLAILIFERPVTLSSDSSLALIEDNRIISIEGTLIKDIPLQSGKGRQVSVLSGNNTYSLSCISCRPMPSLKNANVTIIAFPEKYRNKTYLNILKILESS